MPVDRRNARSDPRRPQDERDVARKLLQQFDRARRGAAGWLFAAATAGIFILGVATLGLFYAVDEAVGLPLMARRVLLVTWTLGVLLAAICAVRRLVKPIDAATIARAAAGRLPPTHRAELIAAAMLIDDAERSKMRAASSSQVTAALRHAADQIGELPWYRELSIGWPVTLLILSWLTLAVFFAFARDDVFVERWLAAPLGSDRQQEQLRFVELPKYAVERQDILVRVRVPVGLPTDQVELSVDGEHGGVDPAAAEPPIGYENPTINFLVRDVRSKLRLQARCGNFAQTPVVELPLLSAAKLLSHEFEVTPPEYTGAPAFRSRERTLVAVEGSVVELTVTADRPLYKANVGFDAPPPEPWAWMWPLDATRSERLPKLAIRDPSSESETRGVFVAVTDEHEAVHYPDYPLEVRVVRDTPPTVELSPPVANDAGEIAFQLRGRASDDFGLTAIRLHLEAAAAEATVVPLFEAADGPAVKEQTIAGEVSYEQLAAVGGRGDGAVSVWLSAEDLKGQVTRSVPFRIEVGRRGGAGENSTDLLESIIRRQRLLAAQLDRLAAQPVLRRDDAQRAAEDQEELADDLAASADRMQAGDEDETVSQTARDAEAAMRSAAQSVEGRQLQAAQAAQRTALAALAALHSQSTAQETTADAGRPEGDGPAQPGEGGSDAERWRQWADGQAAINSQIDAGGDAGAGELAAEQARLQAEVRGAAAALPKGDRRRWAADRAVRLQSQVAAALQRNRLEAPLPQRAALAAAHLESIAEASEDATSAAGMRGATQGDASSDRQRLTAEMLGELRVIEQVQSQLRSQLAAARADGTVSAEAMRGYRDAQSALAERLQEIAAANDEFQSQRSALETE